MNKWISLFLVFFVCGCATVSPKPQTPANPKPSEAEVLDNPDCGPCPDHYRLVRSNAGAQDQIRKHKTSWVSFAFFKNSGFAFCRSTKISLT